ncbi:hypothetical protein F4823DRAFT_565346 [Ustulina deusta]|nr:hypothetical protein F4823DRAFT_565346 [Ustulina deusta]
MRYKSAGFLFVTVAAALSTPLKDSPQPFGVFSNNVIYQPSPPEVLYLRFVEISDGKLLATSTLSGYSPAFSLVFESADGGMDLGYQDSGERLGHVGQAGADGAIRVCYYSNQRDPLHRQKLVHQTSTDLKNWGPVVNGVAYGNYSTIVHEFPSGANITTADYPVYYGTTKSPLEFDSANGFPILSKGRHPAERFAVHNVVVRRHLHQRHNHRFGCRLPPACLR